MRGFVTFSKNHFLLILAALLALLAAPVQAQTFAPINPLNFTKIFGGADPLPQTVTVNSVRAAFNFSRAVVMASGGS